MILRKANLANWGYFYMTVNNMKENISCYNFFQSGSVNEKVTFKMTDNTDKKIGKILSKVVDLCVKSTECFEGYCTYTLSLRATIGFVDLEGEKRSISYIGETSGKLSNENINEQSKVVLDKSVTGIVVDKIVESNVSMTTEYIVEAKIFNMDSTEIFVEMEEAYLEKCEGNRAEEVLNTKANFMVEHSEKIDMDVSMVVSANFNAVVSKTSYGVDLCVVEGKMCGNILLQKEGDTEDLRVCYVEVPFREECDLIGSTVKSFGESNVSVCGCNILVQSDPSKMTSMLEISIEGQVSVEVFKESDFDYISEVYSTTKELEVEKADITSFVFDKSQEVTRKFVQDIEMSESFLKCEGITFSECYLSSSLMTNNSYENMYNVIISALFYGEDGYKSKTFELAESIVIENEDGKDLIVSDEIYLNNVKADLKLDNTVSISFELCGKINTYLKTKYNVITDVEIGEDKPQEEGCIQIYIAKGGESLIEVAKNMNAMPYEVTKQNEGVDFPLERGDKIAYYKPKKSC